MTSFFIETYGCIHNFAESERMAGLLQEAKFEPAETLEQTDIIIFNVSPISGPTEDAFFARLDSIDKEYPYKSIIICGCIAQTEKKRLQKYSLIGSKQIHQIVEVVEETINNNTVQFLEISEMPPLNLPKIRKNYLVEIIPISLGCLSACVFCKSKQTKEMLESYPVEDIIAVAQQAIKEGVKEIWLTSQDTFCYGFDIGTNLANLLKQLIQLPGNFIIRVGRGNPVNLLKIKNELLPLFNHPKVFKFIHVPMQAGSDKVLKDMKRGNTIAEFISLVATIKETIPLVTLATDIIIGFPTETEDDFWQTLEVVRKINPDVINISKFWSKSNTSAKKIEQILPEEVERRTKVLTDIFQNISTLQNERWIGWEGEILITEKGIQDGQLVGRNPAYKPVVVDGQFSLGNIVPVKITRTNTFDLRGEVIVKKPEVKIYRD
ncbi:MAG: tRNA (N(6)-L-threonylcarbamoyladenosine(37)-C(2))-methylthiotransferase [archaeon]|nr:tRNA (N(6)-L-threonylcarbamoyladenosine(37)-C(2))-methylthiotransferase [archaeon]